MKLDITTINELLKDFSTIRNIYGGSKFTKVATQIISEIDSSYGEGEQGFEGQTFEIYQYGEIFIKLDIRSDSYGDNEHIAGLQFVKPIVKSVESFEPLT